MEGPGDAVRRSAVFGDADLPKLFQFADSAAVSRQQYTLHSARRQLVLLVAAAAFSALPWRLTARHIDFFALLSALLYVAALVFVWQAARHRHKVHWQLHRTAAEFLRSQCWSYAVCGAPFDSGAPDPEGLFAVKANDVLGRLRAIGWRDPRPPGTSFADPDLVTRSMRELRAKALTVRREVYVRDRVMEQRDWYHRRAQESRRAALLWSAVTVSATVAALAGALANAFEWGTSMDVVGLASAAAASSVAWTELRQYQPLVAAHSLVAQELSGMAVTLAKVTSPQGWAAEVETAEAVISPDHTAWLARHGGR
ncbi:DUF4231 domain-containing protein [Streptomyces sp. H10-C2]|uniref:DUF4231 domain-containing protein n=1 Tax=unclassified Streptomyces TaxID=2593676 RepID=UPI0024B9CAD9|nr:MULTISPECIES: DUF4231 domain-containing protein [unclassified Streptomyces]MDJ0343137.1 DUF4231 domain-containing protein [Streptomyces sp. PH10-H1]MDJ0371079.1 DUF4231 domain-containing protein [Streptomyces sp. H10-C2]